MTAQPRGPVRVALIAAAADAVARTLATEQTLSDAAKKAHAAEEQRILFALHQRGPMKFRTICRFALPGYEDRVVYAALQRLRASGEVYRWQVRPPIWAVTMNDNPTPEHSHSHRRGN